MSNECDVMSILTFGTIPTDAHYIRTNLQRFVSDQPRSSFEKTGRVNSKAHRRPTFYKNCERKKMALREPLRFHMYQKRRYGATSSCMALWYAKSDREEREF